MMHRDIRELGGLISDDVKSLEKFLYYIQRDGVEIRQ